MGKDLKIIPQHYGKFTINEMLSFNRESELFGVFESVESIYGFKANKYRFELANEFLSKDLFYLKGIGGEYVDNYGDVVKGVNVEDLAEVYGEYQGQDECNKAILTYISELHPKSIIWLIWN